MHITLAGLALSEICDDVHYATVDRPLELVGSGQRAVEVEDRPRRSAAEQNNEHQGPDDASRCVTGQFITILLYPSCQKI